MNLNQYYNIPVCMQFISHFVASSSCTNIYQAFCPTAGSASYGMCLSLDIFAFRIDINLF